MKYVYICLHLLLIPRVHRAQYLALKFPCSELKGKNDHPQSGKRGSESVYFNEGQRYMHTQQNGTGLEQD